MSVNSGDIGFCHYAGHTSGMVLTWDGDTVISVDCGSGDYETCVYADECEFYQRHPVGFVRSYPLKDRST